VLNQLVALDLNRNGQLEPTEANLLSATIMRQVGLDPGQPIYLETLRTFVNQMDLSTVPVESDAGLQIEGEGRRSFEFPSVGGRRRSRESNFGFGSSVNPILSDPTPMEERYSPIVLEEVRSLLQRYDTNGNGVLDPEEIALVPWATLNPLESDLDQDGRLTEIELAERLQALGTDTGGTGGRTRRSRSRAAEGEGGDDPRAAERAAAEEERQRRAEERRQRDRERQSSGSTDRVATYVKELISKLDTDEDGSLTLEEVSTMRNPPSKTADTDGDGILTYAELYAYYGDGQSPSGSAGRSGSTSTASTRDRGPLAGNVRWDGDLGSGRAEDDAPAWPAELARKDQNNDRMISLSEFSSQLTEADRQAFERWDLNRDGYITLSEASQSSQAGRAAMTAAMTARSRGAESTSDGGRASSYSRRGGSTTPGSTGTGGSGRTDSGRTDGGGADSGGRFSRGGRGGNNDSRSDARTPPTGVGSTQRGAATNPRGGTDSNRGGMDTRRGEAVERSGSGDRTDGQRPPTKAPPTNALRFGLFGN